MRVSAVPITQSLSLCVTPACVVQQSLTKKTPFVANATPPPPPQLWLSSSVQNYVLYLIGHCITYLLYTDHHPLSLKFVSLSILIRIALCIKLIATHVDNEGQRVIEMGAHRVMSGEAGCVMGVSCYTCSASCSTVASLQVWSWLRPEEYPAGAANC